MNTKHIYEQLEVFSLFQDNYHSICEGQMVRQSVNIRPSQRFSQPLETDCPLQQTVGTLVHATFHEQVYIA